MWQRNVQLKPRGGGSPLGTRKKKDYLNFISFLEKRRETVAPVGVGSRLQRPPLPSAYPLS